MEPGEYDHIARVEDRHWWYAGMRAAARAWVEACVAPALAAGPARILDAGCGVGGGLRWLSAFGRPVGLDVHPAAVRYSARTGYSVAQGSVQSLPFADAAFDLVTSFEVLYHLAVTDDVAALAELRRVTRPGGWLLVRVPAHNWLRGAHDRQVHTRHRYGRAELRDRLLRAGWRVQRLTPLGAWMLPPAVLARLVQRRGQAQSDVSIPPAPINRLLQAALAAEGRLARRWDLPFGLSLLALARRPAA
jgi:SAM-dependent methyltransferase